MSVLPGVGGYFLFGGKPPVVPGSTTYSTPGSYNFTVQAYNTLTVTVIGGSGGGGGGGDMANVNDENPGSPGTNGGDSTFFGTGGNVIGGGSHGGHGGPGIAGSDTSNDGANGTASGGAGSGGGNYAGGGYAGGSGGLGTTMSSSGQGQAGGTSGKAVKVYTPGQLAIAASISLTVGAAGSGGAGNFDSVGAPDGTTPGNNGSNGQVSISWS
jgi:hypothetical protein